MQRIFELLKERNETLTALASAIGVSTGNVFDWKSGRATPKAPALVKIADHFDVSVDYLLGRTDIREMAGTTSPAVSPADQALVEAYHAAPATIQKPIADLLAPFKKGEDAAAK